MSEPFNVTSLVECNGIYRMLTSSYPDYRFVPPATAWAIISQAKHDANIEISVAAGGQITYQFPEENEYALLVVINCQPHACVRIVHTKDQFGTSVPDAWARSTANKALKRIAWCINQGDPKYISEVLNQTTIYFNTLANHHINGMAGSLMGTHDDELLKGSPHS